MSVNEMFKRKRSLSDQELFYLSWPIFVELFLRVIIGNINVFMISNYSELAVAVCRCFKSVLESDRLHLWICRRRNTDYYRSTNWRKKREQIPKVITTALAGRNSFRIVNQCNIYFVSSSVALFHEFT